ncbi:glycosyltransferase [Humibacter sp. BT305]|nr:glycosyltransferase [Humibacter sp. BT305]
MCAMTARDDRAPSIEVLEQTGSLAAISRAAQAAALAGSDVLLLPHGVALTPEDVAELARVLGASEHHAMVSGSPIALPAAAPRHLVVPVPAGPTLVRSGVLAERGPLDAGFDSLDAALADLALRVNPLGGSAVIAAGVVVGARTGIGPRDLAVLESRYSVIVTALESSALLDADAVVRFASVIDPVPGAPRRILVDLGYLAPVVDGTVRNALTFLRTLATAPMPTDVTVVIAAPEAATSAHDLRRFGMQVVAPDAVPGEFDLGLALAPITDQQTILRLDRHCARWVSSHLDLIAVRVLTLLEWDRARREVVRDALAFADLTVAISRATVDDTLALYPDLEASAVQRIAVVPQGAAKEVHESTAAEVRSGYVLLVGNPYPHKRLREAATALVGAVDRIVVFGSDGEADPWGLPGVEQIAGGRLSDQALAELYRGADVVVYPSSYEGFGLPIAEAAAHGRPLVVADTAVAHEVADVLDLGDRVAFAPRIADLPAAVQRMRGADHVVPSRVRTLDDYNAALLRAVLEVLDRPVDVDLLRSRVRHFQIIRSYLRRPERELSAAIAERDALARRSLRRIAGRLRRRLRGPRL